jgi:hypothetical protein
MAVGAQQEVLCVRFHQELERLIAPMNPPSFHRQEQNSLPILQAM